MLPEVLAAARELDQDLFDFAECLEHANPEEDEESLGAFVHKYARFYEKFNAIRNEFDNGPIDQLTQEAMILTAARLPKK